MDGLVVCAMDWGSNLGSPARPGAIGSAPTTAPFSIPPHHRYRRWMGGVSRLHICFYFLTHALHLGKQNAVAPAHLY